LAGDFDHSVFINCPFDDDYAPILQAIAFCVVCLGFYPRLAPENPDNSVTRLDRILNLVQGSRLGIHDLSRCQVDPASAYARMNMPFELGLDLSCRKFGSGPLASKAILVLEQNRYDTQKALSDISGWDVEPHGGSSQEAIRIVRQWLLAQAGAPKIGATAIEGQYDAFQEWYWEREIASGASEDDIRQYPTIDLVRAMLEWRGAERPIR